MADALPRLAEALTSGRLMVFVGAGLSSGGGLPIGDELADRLAEAAGLGASPLGLGVIAERVELARGRTFLIDFIRRAIEARGRTPLPAHRSLCRLPCDLIVTTNYDLLIEKAYEDLGISYNRICSPSDLVKGERRTRQLFKIHGSIDVDERVARIIVTEKDLYEKFLEGRSILLEILKTSLLTNICLFVGFSMRDPNFLHVFFQIRQLLEDEQQTTEGKFFAVLLDPDPLDVETWAHRGISIIQSDGGEFLESLADELENRYARFDAATGTIELLEGTTLRRASISDLDRVSAFGHYHRYVGMSERKHRFLSSPDEEDPTWVTLSVEDIRGTREEQVVAIPSNELTTDLVIPKQVRTALGLRDGNFDLVDEKVQLTGWTFSLITEMIIEAGDRVGRPSRTYFEEALDRLSGLSASDHDLLRNGYYLQLRPLEIARLGLNEGNVVEVTSSVSSVAAVVLKQERDNLCKAYIPLTILEELGQRDLIVSDPIRVSRRP